MKTEENQQEAINSLFYRSNAFKENNKKGKKKMMKKKKKTEGKKIP